jgi:flagellar biosynthesis protein FlhF
MPIEAFRAANMRDALALVRQRLGADAIVLGSREISRRRFPWTRAVIEIEVTAALSTESAPAIVAQQALHVIERPIEAQPALVEAVEPEFQESVESSDAPKLEVPTDPIFRMFTRLIDGDMHQEHARSLLFDHTFSDDAAALESDLLGIVESQLRCAGGIGLETGTRRVVAMVGPTGVGKTTTIAKLAAHFRLVEQRRVGLITLDTFRAGAVDQLRTYSDVIGVPMRSASNRVELISAIEAFTDLELVLIDTAGRSPRDEPRIQELRDLLSDGAIDEVHLVLSLSGSYRTLVSMAERFQILRPTRLLLTKLDEAAGMGALYSAARGIDLPLSYVTTGQDVPDDIERAAAGRCARLVLGLEDLSEASKRWKTGGLSLVGNLSSNERSHRF